MKIARQRKKRHTSQKGNSYNLCSISWLLQPDDLPSLPCLEDPGTFLIFMPPTPPSHPLCSLSVSRFFEENAESTAFYDSKTYFSNHKADISSQFYTQILRISIHLPYQSTCEK